MHVGDLCDLMERWFLSRPTIRGIYSTVEGELQFLSESRVRGRIVCRIHPNTVEGRQAQIRRSLEKVAEVLEADIARKAGETVPEVEPMGDPLEAFADFSSLEELLEILRGDRDPDFYFDDERDPYDQFARKDA